MDVGLRQGDGSTLLLLRVSLGGCTGVGSRSLTMTAAVGVRGCRIMAYAVSYDWSKGVEHHDPKLGNSIVMHTVQPVEITPKGSQGQQPVRR